ncbi:hypothetical protein [Prosthecobacter vanneervenii]|uniref:SLA1 homology domain-containing protein n=1 Tax=Prosthecobacter vanneervenii TaxID=48466 RepID=A0A7W7YDA4_9BACT|nr:hypothetical protein [Prosthecobacter vanneervenii]MBB5033984.1 hypothetical protein [Prosthecobacter vanneervenii]
MKTRIFSCLGLFAAAMPLSAHEFTDLQGRKLEAEIVSAAAGQVTLKRTADGRVFAVPATTFSTADQQFITEWADNNTKYSFEVTYTKKKLNETRTKSGPVTYEDETWIYKINIRNRLPTTVGDLRVDYWCFRREDTGKGKGSARIETSGSSRLASVVGSGTATVDTKEIILHKQELNGGYYWANGDSSIQSDGMGGLVVRIFDRKGREVYQWSTKEDLMAAAVGKTQSNGSRSQSSNSPK